ncbi:hypothetical protein N657DRAFT_198064 [Parathielavia appendiculata]|uniref:Uncharacterized protein n=1 Tax=Parathielavia appendiculata TaxID=2587402 RepID=A0AAN6U664_9PEZI|nr:hypothetical protein N657DRAFT_198064 [Parathielavia appendiculata]
MELEVGRFLCNPIYDSLLPSGSTAGSEPTRPQQHTHDLTSGTLRHRRACRPGCSGFTFRYPKAEYANAAARGVFECTRTASWDTEFKIVLGLSCPNLKSAFPGLPHRRRIFDVLLSRPFDRQSATARPGRRQLATRSGRRLPTVWLQGYVRHRITLRGPGRRPSDLPCPQLSKR